MELTFNALKSAVADYNTLVAFVDGRGLADTLATVGDVHYEAAVRALEAVAIAVDKRAPVRSAITHLEAAHVAFMRVHRSHRYFRAVTWKLAGFKDVWTLALMATCYTYLHEFDLAKQCVDDAEEVLEHVQNPPRTPTSSSGGGHPGANRAPEDLAIPLTITNPGEWVKLPSLVRFWIGETRTSEFKDFCVAIRRHAPDTFRP